MQRPHESSHTPWVISLAPVCSSFPRKLRTYAPTHSTGYIPGASKFNNPSIHRSQTNPSSPFLYRCDPQHIEWTTAPVVLDYDTHSNTASLKKSFVDLPRSLATALGIYSPIEIHSGGTNYVSMKRVSPTCRGAQALVLSSSPRMSEQTTMQAGTLTLIPSLQLP